jgi:hypothetical protein
MQYDSESSAVVKQKLTTISFSFANQQFELKVNDYGELNEGREPVWILQAGLFDSGEDVERFLQQTQPWRSFQSLT